MHQNTKVNIALCLVPKTKGIVGRGGAKDKKEGKEQKKPRGQLLNSTSKKGTEAK